MAVPTSPTPEGACCPGAGEPLVAAGTAEDLAFVFRALADPTRVRLLAHVAAVPGGTVCACHLPAELGISQPTLSHHLRKLVDAGLLTRRQHGRWAHYAPTPGGLDTVRAFLGAPASVR